MRRLRTSRGHEAEGTGQLGTLSDARKRGYRQLPTQRSERTVTDSGVVATMFATRDLMRARARSDPCSSIAVAFGRPCEKSCVYIAPTTPAPERSLTRGSRRAFNPDLGHPDLSQPGARDDQGHQQEATFIYTQRP